MHPWTCGLSRFMNILGCPKGPPPPSHEVTLFFDHRTGCLWINSIAARGCGCSVPYISNVFTITPVISTSIHSSYPLPWTSTDPQFTISEPARNKKIILTTHLMLHNRLLKSRPHHCLLPRLLTP